MSNKRQFDIPCFSSPNTTEFEFDGYKFIIDSNKDIIREFLHQLFVKRIPYQIEKFLVLTPLDFDITIEVIVIGDDCFGPDIVRLSETTHYIGFDKFHETVTILKFL